MRDATPSSWIKRNNALPSGEDRSALFLLIQFVLQTDTNFNTFYKAFLFMIPAQLINRIDDLIHLPQGHPIHLLVEFVEACPNLLIVIWVVLIVTLVEHGEAMAILDEVPYQPILCAVPKEWVESWMKLLGMMEILVFL